MKFAFYSHKGGVGRTTTAVNTAYQLSKKGKKVCLIDFDMEAPGLTLFDILKPFQFEFDTKIINSLSDNNEILSVVTKEIDKRIDKVDIYIHKTDSIYKIVEFDYLKRELDSLKKQFDSGRIKIKQYKKNDEWIIYDENERCIAGLRNENEMINVISDPLGILEYINEMLESINKHGYSIDKYSSNDEIIKEVTKFAPSVGRFMYRMKKHVESDGDIYTMRVFSPWDTKHTYTEKKSILHSNIIEKYHILEVLIQLIESTYEVDYILIDSRPGLEEYMENPLFNCTDGVFICMDFNKKIEDISLRIGKSLADEDKIVRLVLTKDPNLYKNRYSLTNQMIDERIKSIENTCKKFEMNNTFSTMTIIPYYFYGVIDYNFIDNKLKDKIENKNLYIDDELVKAYKMYEKVANEMIALNPDDILNKINNAIKIYDLNEMKSEFNTLKIDSLYKYNFNLYLEYGKQLQERGQYSDACSELICAYKLQKSSDIAYLIGDLFFKIAIGTYLFSWDGILANNIEELIYFLKKNGYVADEKETNIDKTDDGKTITITAERKIISLSLNNENTEMNLKIDDNISDNLIVKEENGHLNIYDGGNDKSDFESAIEYFEKAEKDCAKKSLLYSKLGDLYFECYKLFPEDDETKKYFDNAIDYYKKVIENDLHDPDNYYKMGEISTKKAGIFSVKSSEKCKLLNDANKYFEQTILRRSSETKARMQWAQNLYDMASITKDDKKKPQYLDKAWELLNELIQEDKEYIKAYYLIGLVQAQLAIHERRDTRRNLLVRACDNLNKILTHEKNDKKAHFYLGAILFIIKEEMEEEETDEKSLYFRDAFYHFEWTVSLHYNSSDFYFTSDEIDTFSTDTYKFVRTLEKLYEFNTPSLFKQWILNEEIDPSEQYYAIIEKAIERKKLAINEVE